MDVGCPFCGCSVEFTIMSCFTCSRLVMTLVQNSFIFFMYFRWRPPAEWSATLPLHDCGWYEVSWRWFTTDWCYKGWEGWIQQSFHGYGLATFLARSLLFRDVTEHRLLIGYWLLGQHIGSISKGQAVQEKLYFIREDGTDTLSWIVGN